MINKPYGALEEDEYEMKLMRELEITRISEDNQFTQKTSNADKVQADKVR